MTLRRRVNALEARTPGELSARVQQWLGQPVSAAELNAANDSRVLDKDWDAIDTSNWSEGLKAWLGVN